MASCHTGTEIMDNIVYILLGHGCRLASPYTNANNNNVNWGLRNVNNGNVNNNNLCNSNDNENNLGYGVCPVDSKKLWYDWTKVIIEKF